MITKSWLHNGNNSLHHMLAKVQKYLFLFKQMQKKTKTVIKIVSFFRIFDTITSFLF